MSRHILAHAVKPGAHFIVGYDRPMGAYFCQSWAAGKLKKTDDCFDLDYLPDLGAVVPEELRSILVKEACGDIDPNYIKDWRTHD